MQANRSPTLHQAFVQSLYAAAIDGLTRDLAPVLSASSPPQQQQQHSLANTGDCRGSDSAVNSASPGGIPSAAPTFSSDAAALWSDFTRSHTVSTAFAAGEGFPDVQAPTGHGHEPLGPHAGPALITQEALAELLDASDDEDHAFDAGGVGHVVAGSGLLQHLRQHAQSQTQVQTQKQVQAQTQAQSPTRQHPQQHPQHSHHHHNHHYPHIHVQQQMQQQGQVGSKRSAQQPPEGDQQQHHHQQQSDGLPGKKRRKGRPAPQPRGPDAATVPPATPPSRAQAAAAVFSLRCLHAVSVPSHVVCACADRVIAVNLIGPLLLLFSS